VAPEISYGLIRISVTTTGGDIDDKYQVVAGSGMIEVTANGNFTMSSKPGQVTVELTGVANNCVVDGSPSVTVDVPRGNTTEVLFRVTCTRTGFQISVHTVGDDMPDSYTLSMTGRGPMSVAANTNFLVSRLAPGAYSLKLESPITTCSSTSPGELSVDLPPRTVVPVTFEVVCTAVVRLEEIAFQVDSAGSSGATSYLALAKPDGTGQTLIGTGSAPSWSPGRTQFAYADADCTGYYYYYYSCFQIIRAIDPEILRKRNLAVGSMPAWSPTDDVVAFVEQNGSLSLVTTSGSTIVRLKTPDSLVTSFPTWSPDGRTIAFTCNSPNGFSRLCVINKDGSGFHQLTDETSDPAVHPAWSHDGSTIAFASIGVSQTAIATIAPSGGTITKLTEGFDPAWSRDGTKLIFARSDGLFTMNTDGSGVARLTTGRHRAPSWRP
jgi:hypothetical protein